MTRYAVYRNPEGAGYLIDLQAPINSHFSTRVVAPLLPAEKIPHPARTLNPVFEIEGASFVMMTQGLAAIPKALLKEPVTSLSQQWVEITAALDLLFQGF